MSKLERVDLPDLVRVAVWQDGSVLVFPLDQTDTRVVAGSLIQFMNGCVLVMVAGCALEVRGDGRWVDRTDDPHSKYSRNMWRKA